MPSYSVRTQVQVLEQCGRVLEQCGAAGRDFYEIKVKEMIPMVAWKQVDEDDTTVKCPFVDNTMNRYKGKDFSMIIPLEFMPDNTDASWVVVDMLKNREDICCYVGPVFIWIEPKSESD